MSSGIYRIDGPNGKFYVGSAKHIGRRWIEHKRDLRQGRHANAKLQSAWNRHGEPRFTLTVLEPVANPGDLIRREQFWIDTLNAVEAGYNILPIAGSHLGRRHSAETKRKMSEIHAGRKHGPMSPEQKAHYSRLYQGRRLSDETRRRMSLARTGRQFSDATKAKLSAASKGKPKSAAHCAALSAAAKRRWASNRNQPIPPPCAA